VDISWITDRIAVGGGIWNEKNMLNLGQMGITHVLDMQVEFDDTPLGEATGIRVLWNPTDDDFQPKPAELLERGVEFALEALDGAEGKVYIHCAAGVHRAPMMALAVLGATGWDLDAAMVMLETQRPAADFADVYVESVRKYLKARGGSQKAD